MKFMSLNVERSNHLERILPFLKETPPELLCLQEVMAGDLEQFKTASGLHYSTMVPMARHPQALRQGPYGIAMLSRYPLNDVHELVYAGQGDGMQLFDSASIEAKLNTSRYVLALATVKTPEGDFHVGTTHFPWTPDGEPRAFQFSAAQRMIDALNNQAVILSGDFNAPRGGPVFAKFTEVWRDWIPTEINTSIDPRLHRAGPLELMVDGLFSSAHYEMRDVELLSGLSDHQAIQAEVRARNGNL